MKKKSDTKKQRLKLLRIVLIRDVISFLALILGIFVFINVVRNGIKICTYVFLNFVFRFPMLSFLIFVFLIVLYIVIMIIICKKDILIFFRSLIKGFKYKYFDVLKTVKTQPCDFSPEKPIRTSAEDDFGFDHLSKGVYRAIRDYKGLRALVFGIYGTLGIGKSSLMNLIKERLSKEQGYIIVSFNAWHFRDIVGIYKGFIRAIEKQISEVAGITRPRTIIRKWKSAMDLRIGLQPSIVVRLQHHDVLELESAKESIGEWLACKRLKLIVFMDDLDRCTKDEAIFTLKLLRCFADFNSTVFIVGYDKSKVMELTGMEIEKFIDQEIPVAIEKEQIYSWFWSRAKSCRVLNNEMSKLQRDQSIMPYFIRFFLSYCNNPRRVKIYLNDLLIALPIVKNKIYFPHFMVITLLKRDLPKLYDLITDGRFFILQSESYVDAEMKELVSEFERYLREIYKEEEKVRRAYCYIRALGGNLLYKNKDGIIVEDGQLGIPQISDRDYSWLVGYKKIWNEGFTESYFIWKESYNQYSEVIFKNMVKNILGDKEDGSIKFALSKIKKAIKDKKIESLLFLIRLQLESQFNDKLANVFIGSLAKAESNVKNLAKISALILKIIYLFKKYKRYGKIKKTISKMTNPLLIYHFLQNLKLDQMRTKRIETDELEKIKQAVKLRFRKIFMRPTKCFCELNIPLTKAYILEEWGDQVEVKKYLQALQSSKVHKEHFESLIIEISKLITFSKFFKSIYNKFRKPTGRIYR